MAALRKVVVLAGLALAAAPAAAQTRPAALGEIFESYNDCFAATDGGSLSPDALAKLGWAKGEWDTKKPEGPFVFGHGDRAPVILLTSLKGEGMCIVLARIENEETYEGFKAAFGGQLPKANAEGVIFYRANNRIVRLARTGTQDKPSMSLAVGTPAEK